MMHASRHGGMSGRRRSARVAVAVSGLVVAVVLTACSSTESTPPTTTSGSSTSGTSSGTHGIPSSAFSDTTGLTSSSVTVGNVSTLAFGLFRAPTWAPRRGPTT